MLRERSDQGEIGFLAARTDIVERKAKMVAGQYSSDLMQTRSSDIHWKEKGKSYFI